MTLRTEEGTVIWRRKLWIAICGGIVLEEALNLSSDRLLDDGDDVHIQWRRKLWIAICGGIVLEEALDLSLDRLINEWTNKCYIYVYINNIFISSVLLHDSIHLLHLQKVESLCFTKIIKIIKGYKLNTTTRTQCTPWLTSQDGTPHSSVFSPNSVLFIPAYG